MKKTPLFLLLLISIAPPAFTQSVGIGTTTPHASALLDVSSNNKGILIPTMTAAQRSGIASPATGLLVFQTDGTPGFCYYNGTAWISLTKGLPVNSQGFSLTYGATTTLAGSGVAGSNDGAGAGATFSIPSGIAADAFGNVYVCEYGSHKIRKITSGGVVSTLAGSGVQGAANGIGAAATFNRPTGLATDAQGNVYVADMDNHKIRKITSSGVVSTLAGSGASGSADGAGNVASFSAPTGVAVDVAGNVYVADRGNNVIRKITPSGDVSTVAGTRFFGSVDGPAATASFREPFCIAVDPAGNVFVADWGNHKIRLITPGGMVSTLAGSGSNGVVDGTGTAASFIRPVGITIDAAGNLYITDALAYNIRKIVPLANGTGVVTTLAGTGAAGNADGPGTSATFDGLREITIDASGILYIVDNYNNKIRKIVTY